MSSSPTYTCLVDGLSGDGNANHTTARKRTIFSPGELFYEDLSGYSFR